MMPQRIFIGFDAREAIAFHVLAHSILTRASVPVSITPLVRSQLAVIHPRPRGPLDSTDFSITRFLVPYLCGYQGLGLYLDCDMLCRVDIVELYELFALAVDTPRHCPDEAVWVVQHAYTPKSAVKFLGEKQTVYARKNWSSLMLFNTERCRILTPRYVDAAEGLELHQFAWTADHRIGALPLEWNVLVDEDHQSAHVPKIVHFTNGGPWLSAYKDVPYADEWRAELEALLHG
jgi:hypothetical protein